MRSKPAPLHRTRPAGFTLVEIMVALTVGLILLTALSLIYVSNSSYRTELDISGRSIENGVFAIDRLTDDLRKAGYYSDFDLAGAMPPVPLTEPDACATDLISLGQPQPPSPATNVPLSANTGTLLFAVQGYDAPSSTAKAVLPASCSTYITDLRKGSDVVLIRRTDTCTAGPTVAAGCDAVVAGRAYFQASQCSPTPPAAQIELAAASSNWYRLDTATASLNLHKIDCGVAPPGTTANYRRFLVNIYFVANNDDETALDGIPTLKLAQLDGAGFTVVPIAEGIETMQLEYGLDTQVGAACNLTGDGSPDVYTANPDTYGGAGTCVPTPTFATWLTVVAVKVHLLARNTQAAAPGLGYVNAKTYNLGFNADGTANTVGPYNDAFRRHVYASMVRLYNPAGRRQP